MQGVLSVDKPGGISSHDVVSRIRRLSGVRRVGHAGTLDPLATGVLVVCVGRTTRLVEYLMGQPKWYEATVHLGQSTDTYDAEGEVVVERPYAHLTSSQIFHALHQFQGDIQQIPPMYSAVKKGGQPLYKLARQGLEVERAARSVTVYQLELTRVSLPEIHLRVHCSTGTYIRSLAHDLGEVLGCGGHIAALRRTAVGKFDVQTAVLLSDLTVENLENYLLPAESAVSHLPRVDFVDDDAQRLLMGQQVMATAPHPQVTLVRAYDVEGRFIGIVQRNEDGWQARKMFPALGGQ